MRKERNLMAHLKDLIVTGVSRFIGKVYASEFVGKLTGNADTATNATKVNGHTVNSDVPANAKFSDTVYTHPTTSGNKHIPAGGSSGQILRWSADGTAVWGADNNTDTKVTQTNTTSNADYRVVLSTNANDTTETNTRCC